MEKVLILVVACNHKGGMEAFVCDEWDNNKNRRWVKIDPEKVFHAVEARGFGHCENDRLVYSRYVENTVFSLKDIELVGG